MLICNLAGVFLFAAVVGHTAVFPPEARTAFDAIGTKAQIVSEAGKGDS